MSEDEEILLEINPAMFRNNPIGFIACVILVAAAGLGLVILGVWWVLTKADELSISNKRTVQRVGLFSKRTSEVLHRDVRNIEINQTFFQRLCGVGSIGISSAGQAGVEIQFKGVEDPDGVKTLIDRYRDL